MSSSLPQVRSQDKVIYADFQNKGNEYIDAAFAPDSEAALLGCFLLKGGGPLVAQYRDRLNKDIFGYLRNAYVWRAIELAYDDPALEVNLMSVKQTLKDQGTALDDVGGLSYLMELQTSVLDRHAHETYYEFVRRAWVRRSMMHAGDQITALAHDTTRSIETITIEANGILSEIVDRGLPQTLTSAIQAAHEVIDFLESDQPNQFMPTGLRDLDALIGGIERRKYHGVLARTGTGKSFFAQTLAHSMARQGYTVIMLSNEMMVFDMMLRFSAMESGVIAREVSTKSLTQPKYAAVLNGLNNLSKLDLHLDHVPQLTPAHVEGYIHRVEDIENTVVIIDGLYNMTVPNGERLEKTRRYEEVSGQLLKIARLTGVPIIVTHQTSKAPDSRNNKHPILADSYYCDKFPHDVDIMIGLHREWVYDKSVPPHKAEALLLKARDNAGGTVPLYFDPGIAFKNANSVTINLGDED